MPEKPLIRSAERSDSKSIARIYNHFIRESIATFETEEVSAAEMARRIEQIQSQSFPWLVVEHDGAVAGYAYAGPWHARCAYRHSAEMTVYLDPDFIGRGLGLKLYQQLIEIVAKRDIHTVIGGIALPNDASVALHEKFGFRKVAHYQEVGFKFDRWIDVGYWQRIL